MKLLYLSMKKMSNYYIMLMVLRNVGDFEQRYKDGNALFNIRIEKIKRDFAGPSDLTYAYVHVPLHRFPENLYSSHFHVVTAN